MIRLFETHKIRKTEELSGKMWDFTPLAPEQPQETQKVLVPGCVETYPGFGNYRGWCAYETAFEAEGNVRLEFKGVSHYAKVYVDEELVAEHYGSYTPFDVVCRNLSAGTHALKVLTDNDFRDEYALDMPNDYMSYGGISRGVALENIGEAYIKYVHATPLGETDGAWLADVEIVCENVTGNACEGSIRLNIADTVVETETKTLLPGETVWELKGVRVPGVKAWSMESPALYQMEAVLVQDGKETDDWIDRIGFRTVRVEGKRVLLNGRPIRIKGFCRHEDHPQYGCALPAQAIAYDLQLIKDMGGNSVRTTHYPNDELFLDLCDEMGILVWEENHARGFGSEQMANPYFEPQCEQVIREMITCHYNHPSIYIWGILNECASESEVGRKCYQAQYELIRSLDTSRPCSSASCKFNKDICQDLPDVCSWNMYPYWYEEKTATQMAGETMRWAEEHGGSGKPFLITEIGAGGIYAFRDQAHDVWSEDLQAEILRKQLTEVAELEDCMGLYIWQFCDVRVSRTWWAIRRPKSRNNKGVVDEYRRPKMAYHVVKEIFGKLPDYWDGETAES
ncbi:MAG: glycoside hydrolase family 2 TIM barrel-domain containing protein [Eubacteriales bacterium]|nr:glycoside hydrolase family 2 TIM barrel-domain containing protein [Eubacteriales bacterium]